MHKWKKMIFYWACPVLNSLNYTSREIAAILQEQGFCCGKTTVNNAIRRNKEFGTPVSLKRGRPRESGAGK